MLSEALVDPPHPLLFFVRQNGLYSNHVSIFVHGQDVVPSFYCSSPPPHPRHAGLLGTCGCSTSTSRFDGNSTKVIEILSQTEDEMHALRHQVKRTWQLKQNLTYQKELGRRRPLPQLGAVQVTLTSTVFWRHQWQVKPVLLS